MDNVSVTNEEGTSKMGETINFLSGSYLKDQGDRRIILRPILEQNTVRMGDKWTFIQDHVNWQPLICANLQILQPELLCKAMHYETVV